MSPRANEVQSMHPGLTSSHLEVGLSGEQLSEPAIRRAPKILSQSATTQIRIDKQYPLAGLSQKRRKIGGQEALAIGWRPTPNSNHPLSRLDNRSFHRRPAP